MSRLIGLLCLLASAVGLAAADIETVKGETFTGVTLLEETADKIRFELQEGRQKMAIALPKSSIHRIRETADGPWRTITEKPEPPPKPPAEEPPPVEEQPPEPVATGPVMWRRDGTGRYPACTAAPTRWSATENVRWQTPMPNWGNASPIVVGEAVVCCAEPHTVLCLERATGKIRWQVTNAPPEVLGEGHEDPGEVEPKSLRGWTCATPAADSRWVYVAFGQGMLVALDLADGKRAWGVPLDTGSRWGPGLSASPLLAGDLVIQQTNAVHAIERATGKTRWAAGGGTGLHGTPTLMELEGETYVVQTHGQLIRLRDGQVVVGDRVEKPWQNWGPSVVVAGDIAVLHFHGKPKNSTCIRAYRYAAAGTRTQLWEFIPEPEHGYFTRMGNSPLIHDGLVYAVTDGGHLQVLELETGELVYEHKWGKHSYSSLCLAAGNVYATGKDTMHVFAAGREFEPVADFKHGFSRHEVYPWLTVASPFFAEDALYFRDRENLWCIAAPATPAKESKRRRR